MEPIVSSETSAIRTQTPGNYPKRNKLQTAVSFLRQPKHIKILLGQNSVFSMLERVLYTVTTVGLKVKNTEILDSGRVVNGSQVE